MSIAAQFPGTCKRCLTPIRVNEMIAFDEDSYQAWVHQHCRDKSGKFTDHGEVVLNRREPDLCGLCNYYHNGDCP